MEATIGAIGGTVEMAAEGGLLVEATLSPVQLERMLGDNGVLWIDRWTPADYRP